MIRGVLGQATAGSIAGSTARAGGAAGKLGCRLSLGQAAPALLPATPL